MIKPVASHFIEPMYATSIRELPEGNVWNYEAKLDGYRCLASKHAGQVALWSRRGNAFNSRFPEIVRACEHLPPDTIIDGEVIAVDESGKISFNALQHQRTKAVLQFYVFDILMLRGRSLLQTRLEVRRKLLSETLFKLAYPVIQSQSFNAKPADLIQAAKELQFEGIIAKHNGSFYEPGKRSLSWLKYKLHRSQEFVIGGYTPGNPFDALIVGYYEASKLIYAGKVRNGFVPHVRREVFTRLKELQAETCPFINLPEKKRTQWALTREEMKKCIWLKPELVAQIEFNEWTPDYRLRYSKFVGLRDDKPAVDVKREEVS
jgi:DNA ligase D-like protein (predicted ligase)